MTFQKNQLISAFGKNLKCVVADHEYAVFCEIKWMQDDDGSRFKRTNMEEVSIVDNTGTAPIEYATILNLPE